MKLKTSNNPNLPFEPTIGTHFLPKPNPMVDRKWWILHGLATYGTITIDSGAFDAIVNEKSSLFAAGITKVEGSFVANQSVNIVTIMKVNSPNENFIKTASSSSSSSSLPTPSISADSEPINGSTNSDVNTNTTSAITAITTDNPTDMKKKKIVEKVVTVGKGIVNYTSSEISRLKGNKSMDIETLLGYVDSDCIIHRDNIVITMGPQSLNGSMERGKNKIIENKG